MNVVNWSAATGAGLIGAGVGFLLGMRAMENSARGEYEKATGAMRQAYEAALNMKGEAPVKTEDELIVEMPIMDIPEPTHHEVPEPNLFDNKIEDTRPKVNPYHQSITDVKPTPAATFVAGNPNEYGVSYIEEEDYDEECGRAKGTVTIMQDDMTWEFFLDGVKIDDWAERLGASILTDFFEYAQSTRQLPAVLYVRNHATDTDYEVLVGTP